MKRRAFLKRFGGFLAAIPVIVGTAFRKHVPKSQLQDCRVQLGEISANSYGLIVRDAANATPIDWEDEYRRKVLKALAESINRQIVDGAKHVI